MADLREADLRQPGLRQLGGVPTQTGHPTEAGFTLVEMLAALGILLLGVTSLLGALSSTVALRRTTDARLEATAVCDYALQRVQEQAVRKRADAATDLDLEVVPLDNQTVPGIEGMVWSATTVLDEQRPDVWLVRLQVRWQEEGEDVVEEFVRLLPRQLPLGQRVRRFRDQRSESSGRRPQ
jgi:prepilin-type N-terminal cleavage/methylation domain-containing protein